MTSCSPVTARSALCLLASPESPEGAGKRSDAQVSRVQGEQPCDAPPARMRVGLATTAPRVAPAVGAPRSAAVNSRGFSRHVRRLMQPQRQRSSWRVGPEHARCRPPGVISVNACYMQGRLRRHKHSQPSSSDRNELHAPARRSAVALDARTFPCTIRPGVACALTGHCCWHVFDVLRNGCISRVPRQRSSIWPTIA